MIKSGDKISLQYTVFLEDGVQIDSNVGQDPLVVTLGLHQVFPALENHLLGQNVGSELQVILKAEEAYGPILEEAYRAVSTEMVPIQYRYVGAVLAIQDPQGGVYPIRVHRVQDDTIVLDFNHPLAGKGLKFDLKVLNVESP